jgi:CHASE2 domain-containing sensor protein
MLLQDPILRAVGRSLSLDDVVVIAIPGETRDPRALRSEHPSVVGALVEAGARAIVFDLAFLASMPEDTAFAEALRAARDAGIPVLAATPFRDERPVPPGSRELAEALRLGAVISESDTHFWKVRRMPVRFPDLDGGVSWHLAVETARAVQGRCPPPEIEDDVLVIGSLRNALVDARLHLPPAGAVPSVPYGEPSRFGEARGRVALVGLVGGTQDLLPTPDGRRYGVEVLAVEIQTLLRQAGLRGVAPGLGALLTLCVLAGTLGIGTLLPRRGILPLALGGGFTVLCVAVALTTAGILLPFLPVVLSCLLGYLALLSWKKPVITRSKRPMSRSMRPRLPGTHPILGLLLLLLASFGFGPGAALGGERFGRVEEILVTDARGEWARTQHTAKARILREGRELPVYVGMEIDNGERLVTESARLRVVLRRDEYIHIWENADVTVRERGILQRLGDVYYALKGHFSVSYGTVETVVEGTRFTLAGPEPVRVIVEEGRVRVRSGDEVRVVRAGETLAVPAAGLGARAARTSTRALMRTVDRSRWLKGRPTGRVGFLLGPAGDGEGALASGRFVGGIQLPSRFGLTLDSGILLPLLDARRTAGGEAAGTAFPQGAGIELQFPFLSLGGQALGNVRTWKDACGQTHAVLVPGAAFTGRLDLPVTRRLLFMTAFKVGYAGEPMLNADFGLGVAL